MRRCCALIIVLSACAAAETRLGKPLELSFVTPIAELVAAPERYVGKKVRVKGRITAVCQKMGCWMNLSDPASGKAVRIKVNDGEIVFPKEAMGKTAVAEGVLEKIQLSKEQAIAYAKHEAEELGRKFDPNAIKAPTAIYQIRGQGAVVEE